MDLLFTNRPRHLIPPFYYRESAKLSPNRYRTLLGIAKSAAAVGDKGAAREAFAKLLALARDGDHARDGDAAAKAFLAANG